MVYDDLVPNHHAQPSRLVRTGVRSRLDVLEGYRDLCHSGATTAPPLEDELIH
jgi:hypothetical protein